MLRESINSLYIIIIKLTLPKDLNMSEPMNIMFDTASTEVVTQLADATADALSSLPIAARLRFVENIISDQGGEKANYGQNPALVTANEVLRGVLKVIESNPRVAALVWPSERSSRPKKPRIPKAKAAIPEA